MNAELAGEPQPPCSRAFDTERDLVADCETDTVYWRFQVSESGLKHQLGAVKEQFVAFAVDFDFFLQDQ